ncbi:L-type lectin-domain containing receptor kinase -like [Olea europaea subsp. europaea]|uniref:L-type lectin-domain containing receptor kinase -like n=2 Tax=Olea europaea subsp. europaea TaxID=158383 RepID=A0A8S0S0H6_OLEEU|nr:L-type lectin-domain containing receptor kinase -like [Olea europaea subsp. europaea]
MIVNGQMDEPVVEDVREDEEHEDDAEDSDDEDNDKKDGIAVGCGRRPIEPRAPTEEIVLVDWVFSHWTRGVILQAIDPKLGYDYVKEEVELVLKLGLLCSHSESVARPNMRQILLYLEGSAALPDISSLRFSAGGLTFAHAEGFVDSNISEGNCSSVAASLLSGGR